MTTSAGRFHTKPPGLHKNHNTVVLVLTRRQIKIPVPFPVPSFPVHSPRQIPPNPSSSPTAFRRHCLRTPRARRAIPDPPRRLHPPSPPTRHFPRKAWCPSGGLLGGCCFCRTAASGFYGGRRHGGEAFPGAAPGHADRPRAPRRRLRAPDCAVRSLWLRQARRGLLPRQPRLPPRPRRPFLRFLRLCCTARSPLRCHPFRSRLRSVM